MLVLRRKVGESIVLAGVINVSVLAVEGERVKIGISAPPDVTIVREELLRTAIADPVSNQSASPTPVQPRG
jgi:carbon storage regulator